MKTVTVLPLLSAFLLASAALPTIAAPKVVATFGPVYGITAFIMQDVGTPDLLIDEPVSPHHYTLRPSKRQLLDEADVVYGIGGGMEGGIWPAIEELGIEHLELIAAAGDRLIDHDADGHVGHSDDHEDDHDGHEGGDGHGHEGHGHAIDPHIWLDSEIAADMATLIAQDLIRRDPANAEAYERRAAGFRHEIGDMNADLSATFAQAGGREIVSYHDAFAYFARQWGLHVDFVVAEPELSPSAAKVAELESAASAGRIACFIIEPQFSPDLVTSLAGDHDIPVFEVDPEGNTLVPTDDLYFNIMERLFGAFRECVNGQ